jgi:hypothetical protein
MGRRASKRYALFKSLFRNSIEMLAKLIRRGCAERPPVIAEIFVLSEDKTTPRIVAPGPSAKMLMPCDLLM